MSAWSEAAEAVYPDMVKWRRYLHMNPELSFQESQTAGFVAGLLQEWGLEVRTGVGGHGVVARIKGSGEGPTVALRADMDALPIQDEKSCEYASRVPGVMHACGHDAHTAALLGVAKLLNERKERLAGNVVFVFQPAEETTPGGALGMIRDGALDGVDVIYGIHLWTPFEAGAAYCKSGPMMAAADEFIIEIRGKGGHGGLPHNTVDSIYVASQLVINLQGIVSRFSDPTQPCVVTVGSFHSGTNFNVIAETATLKGTVRTFDSGLRLQVKRRLEEIAEQTCRMNGAECTVKYNLGYPPVINHAEEAERFRRAAAAVLGDEGSREAPLIMAGEDYAYYLERIPGCFMFVGAGHEKRGIVHPHHHPRFDIEEVSMLHAAKLFIQMTEDFMAEHTSG